VVVDGPVRGIQCDLEALRRIYEIASLGQHVDNLNNYNLL
jgi:hypothetical protein